LFDPFPYGCLVIDWFWQSDLKCDSDRFFSEGDWVVYWNGFWGGLKIANGVDLAEKARLFLCPVLLKKSGLGLDPAFQRYRS